MQKKTIGLLVIILFFIGAYHLVKQDKKIKTDSKTDKGLSVSEDPPKKQEKITQAKMPVPLNYWVHFDPKTASQSLSAYGEFFNVNTDKALYLTSVENKDFERVELHTVKDGKDILVSTDTDTDKALILPPMGGSVKLEYGGNYGK